jgi:hypothetical protein
MKQNSNIDLKSKVKWKECLNRTASFNKKNSSNSLMKENSINHRIKERNNIDSKSKESNLF